LDSGSIDHFIEGLRSGEEKAFHALIEAPHAVLGTLIARFHAEGDPDLRASIVEVVWQHRQSNSVPFLAQALADSCEEVWKQALDGLVTIGGPSAVEAVSAFKSACDPGDPQAEWLAEALGQLGA
jgi:HEAT repeat protein